MNISARTRKFDQAHFIQSMEQSVLSSGENAAKQEFLESDLFQSLYSQTQRHSNSQLINSVETFLPAGQQDSPQPTNVPLEEPMVNETVVANEVEEIRTPKVTEVEETNSQFESSQTATAAPPLIVMKNEPAKKKKRKL